MPTELQNIRVLSYNIHKGFSVGKKNFILRNIKKAIHAVHADIVFLQEVQGQHETHAAKISDWPTQSQFEFIADSLWPHYAYGQNAVYVEGHHGNAILSKFPIASWINLDISTNPLESRGLLHARLEVPKLGMELNCCCVHLNLFHRGRYRQLQQICRYIEESVKLETPLILAGDFNDWRGRACRVVEDVGLRDVFKMRNAGPAKTFPSWYPLLALDRIYSRNCAVAGVRTLTGVPWNRLSDHAALYAELSISLAQS